MTRSAMLIGAVLVALAVMLPAAPARAEETRTVGPYTITVSFASTPVYPEEANALLVQVTDADGAPVLGLEDTLRLRVGIPNQVTETMPVQAAPRQPGVYRVDLLLPRAAPYTMNLLGTIRDLPVDQKYLTGRDGLDKVIVRGRQYPKGSGLVVLGTLGFYLVGLAFLVGRAAVRRRHRPLPRPLP